MKLYLAPMEGLTGYIYRNAYHKYFHAIDRYFTPFICSSKLNYKEKNDILPEHNIGMEVIPQILTNQAEVFLRIARILKQYGYETVNLNLGCPSGTVVAKKRGSGFLAAKEELTAFLDEVFDKSPCRISIKTRLGTDSDEGWPELLSLYEAYPLEELIIHPRIQKDFYQKEPRLEAFAYAAKHSRLTLCYNGDICTPEDYAKIISRFPQTDRIMIGRGVIKNPGLPGEIKGEAPVTMEKLRAFHDELLCGYEAIMSGDRNVLYRMKELWAYMGGSFTHPEKYQKKIRKSERLEDYRAAVDALFELEAKRIPPKIPF